jgi:hypothetical protein
MNQRMKELARSSGFDVDQAADQFNGHILYNSLDRYGQMILRTCLEQISPILENDQQELALKSVEEYFDIKL